MPKIELIELHMASAHFPIALLMCSALFEVLGYWRKNAEFHITSFWIHMLGVPAAVLTLVLGAVGNPFREDLGWFGNIFHDYGNAMANRAARHSWVGAASLILFGLLAVWRWRRRDKMVKTEFVAYWCITALAVAAIGLSGYLGAHVMD